MNMADIFFLMTEFTHQQTADEERFPACRVLLHNSGNRLAGFLI